MLPTMGDILTVRKSILPELVDDPTEQRFHRPQCSSSVTQGEFAAAQLIPKMLAQCLLADAKLLGDVGLGETKSRGVLNERALGIGRLIFGWHLPFHVAQIRDARALDGKLSHMLGSIS
jgi:hypothetical protein